MTPAPSHPGPEQASAPGERVASREPHPPLPDPAGAVERQPAAVGAPLALPLAVPVDGTTRPDIIPPDNAPDRAGPAPSAPAAQVGQAVQAFRHPEGTIELRLAPEELGQVRIDMRSEGDRLVLAISAERPETLDLLRRHADQLAADLRATGQQGVNLSFGRWSGPGHGAQPDFAPPREGKPAPDVPLAQAAPPARHPLPAPPATGLYLRI